MLKGKLLEQLHGLHGSLLCGVSGGADSMALLSLLIDLRDAGRISLSACHVNHALRGEASDADEAFVRDYCRAHGVPLHSFRLTPPENPGEDWARNARYDAFSQAMALSGADALVLAHHRDDQAETVLEHLLRGSGLDGLCGMQRETVMHGMRIVRPLLDVSRSDLKQYLERNGQAWREDQTNEGDDYLRNRVRHQLTPLLEVLAPGASTRIAETAQLLRLDADVLQAQADAWLAEHPYGWLPVKELAAMQDGMRSRILRKWWMRETRRSAADASATRTLMTLIDAPVGTRLSLPGGRSAFRGWRFIHLDACKEQVTPQAITGCGVYPMGACTVTIAGSEGSHGNGCTEQELPEALLEGCELRTRRPGDWISPFGMKGRQSLQDYFVNRRIDEPFRDLVPLVCRGSEVLFVCGVGAGDIPYWSPEHNNKRIIISGMIPWNRVSEGSIN